MNETLTVQLRGRNTPKSRVIGHAVQDFAAGTLVPSLTAGSEPHGATLDARSTP